MLPAAVALMAIRRNFPFSENPHDVAIAQPTKSFSVSRDIRVRAERNPNLRPLPYQGSAIS
jgi:hypothetical protein